jgi:lactate racemase
MYIHVITQIADARTSSACRILYVYADNCLRAEVKSTRIDELGAPGRSGRAAARGLQRMGAISRWFQRWAKRLTPSRLRSAASLENGAAGCRLAGRAKPSLSAHSWLIIARKTAKPMFPAAPVTDARNHSEDAMKVELLYGKATIEASVPPGCHETLIRKQPRAPLLDPHGAILEALARPIGAPPLVDYARGKRSACILICDITRPVPNHLFLRPLIEQLMTAGITPEAITVLIATGLHRPNEGEELERVVGDRWVLDKVRVTNHFARDDAAHVDFGRTKGRGVPVKLDRRFVEAQVRIATGLVEPHFMAGYSGGRKVVAPGIAHADTIRTFHSAAFMEDPAATSCNLTGNPLHEEQLEIVRLVGNIMALNAIINEQRQLVFVSYGDILASHMAAVRFVDDWIQVPVSRRFATIVTSAAGFPLDQTYYQTVKGMVTPIDILAPGGTLIVASDCSEGLGSKEFRASQRRLVEMGPDGFLRSILPKALADIDEWQTEMQLKPMRIGQIKLYTGGLPDEDRALTGVEVVTDLDATIRDAVAAAGDGAAAFIPEGPYVIPKYVGA